MKLLKTFSYKNLTKIQKSAIWFTFANVLNMGLTVLTTPIFTRILSPSEIGQYSVYTTWYNIFCTLITLNLAYGIYETLLVEHEEDRDNLTSSLATLTFILCLIGLFLFTLFNQELSGLLGLDRIYLYIMIIDIFANLMTNFFETSNRFLYNYKKCVIFSVILSFSRIILSLILTIAIPHNKLLGRVIGMMIPYGLVSLVLFCSFLLKGKEFINVYYWKIAVKFNIILVPHYLSSTILASSDRVMIAKLVNDSKAGIYSICYSCAALMGLFFGAINSVYTPYTYRALRDKNYDELRINTTLLVKMTMFAALLLILFSPEAIKIFAPIEYYEGIYMMPALVVGIYLTFMYYLFSNIEFYYKKNIYVTIATLIGALLNISLNMILIPIFGYFAAAYTTLIGYSVMALLHYNFYRKTLNEKIYDMKKICLYLMNFILLSFTSLFFYPYFLIRLLIGLIILLVAYKNIKKMYNF